jgi:hypothetical protein
MFAAPSPKNTNHAGLYLTKAGTLVDRHGRRWGRSQIVKLAMDAALPGSEQSAAMTELRSALHRACNAAGLTTEQHQEIYDLIHEHLSGQAEEDRGAGATDRRGRARDAGPLDRHRVPGDEDGDDGFEKFREYLRGQNLDHEAIEAAVAIAKRDHEIPTTDRLPDNARHGGMGGRLSGRSNDDDFDYGETEADPAPYTGLRPTELRPATEPFWNSGKDPVRNLPGGGTSRRLSNDRALATDADLTREYPGIEHTKVGW